MKTISSKILMAAVMGALAAALFGCTSERSDQGRLPADAPSKAAACEPTPSPPPVIIPCGEEEEKKNKKVEAQESARPAALIAPQPALVFTPVPAARRTPAPSEPLSAVAQTSEMSPSSPDPSSLSGGALEEADAEAPPGVTKDEDASLAASAGAGNDVPDGVVRLLPFEFDGAPWNGDLFE